MRATKRDFEAFVSASAEELIRTGYLLTWDMAEAEDLVQETLLRVARHWTRVRAMDFPLAYARRILVNLCIDGQRRRFRTRSELVEDFEGIELADPDASAAFEQIEDQSQFAAALAALPRQQRAVIVLRYWQDLSEAEVADMLGCSVGTVKKATWRALKTMRAHLSSGLALAGAPERKTP